MTLSREPMAARRDWLPEFPDDVAGLVADRQARLGLTRQVAAPLPPQEIGSWGATSPAVALDEPPPVPAEPDVDLDLAWLAGLRGEHHARVDAWLAAARAVVDARDRFAAEDDAYRVELRAAVRAGRDPNEVPVPGSGAEVRGATLDVLREAECAARRALGEFALRVIEVELPEHGDVLGVLAALARGPSPSRAALDVSRAAGRLHRLADSHYSDRENEKDGIKAWVGGSR